MRRFRGGRRRPGFAPNGRDGVGPASAAQLRGPIFGPGFEKFPKHLAVVWSIPTIFHFACRVSSCCKQDLEGGFHEACLKVLELMKRLANEKESGKDDAQRTRRKTEKKGDAKEEKMDKSDEAGSWSAFWKESNKSLKVGCCEDDSNRSELSRLLRFSTTSPRASRSALTIPGPRAGNSGEHLLATGGSMEVMQKAPSLQILKTKDLELPTLDDHLDEPCLQRSPMSESLSPSRRPM